MMQTPGKQGFVWMPAQGARRAMICSNAVQGEQGIARMQSQGKQKSVRMQTQGEQRFAWMQARGKQKSVRMQTQGEQQFSWRQARGTSTYIQRSAKQESFLDITGELTQIPRNTMLTMTMASRMANMKMMILSVLRSTKLRLDGAFDAFLKTLVSWPACVYVCQCFF
eukprot:1148316-Pelagomonas_calceolata.AAC.2